MINQIKKLSDLYLKQSKHSSYQKVHPEIEKFLYSIGNIEGKYEAQRQLVIESAISFEEKSVLEIGCNTGYFTIAAAMNGASIIDAYEGNAEHCEFIKTASELITNGKTIRTHNKYYIPSQDTHSKYDICIFLNVLHHLGEDYLNENENIEKAKDEMIQYLTDLSFKTNTLIFQMGFNWKGNKHLPLFQYGAKHELISFVKDAIKNNYHLEKILCPISKVGDYREYLKENLNTERNNEIGEFLNRPFFIMTSKNHKNGH